MRAHGVAWISALLVSASTACHKDDQLIAKRLDELDKKVTALGAKIDALAARGGPAQRRPQQRRGPDAGKTYSIPIDDAPILGAKDAAITVVKAFEFACPACEAARGFEDQILAKWGDRIRVAHKNYIVHPGRAEAPAYAACAAHAQGKYREMADLIWEKGFKARKLDRDNMVALAEELGLDLARFERDMDERCPEVVKRDQRQLAAIGTRGTPTFFVNGRVLQQRSLAGFEKLVAEEQKKAEQRIASGTPAGTYYDEWVVKRGAKTM